MEDTRYRVLTIEDEELYRKAFMRLVEQENLPYDCTIAKSVAEAQEVLKSKKFDVILADYSLGDGTAFDIDGLFRFAPTIMITGVGDEQVVIKAWRDGAYGYLVKDLERKYLQLIPISIEAALERRKTTEKVQLLSAAVMSTNDSVFITDPEDTIIFVNKAFCDTYGYDEEEIIGQSSDVLQVSEADESKSSDGSEYLLDNREELYHMHSDASRFPVLVSKSAIKDDGGQEVAFVSVARDISERVFVEDKIEALNLKLKEGIRANESVWEQQ